jgi:hypothetical protein
VLQSRDTEATEASKEAGAPRSLVAHPTFIIIGAMKAGTTSLYRYLAAHPEVSVSAEKETNYFLGGDEYRRGASWYASLFDATATARGEASPNYAKRHLWPGVPERIAALTPEARLIYTVRDPIARVVSHFAHNRSHGRETRSFSAAITQDPKYAQTSMYAYQLDAFSDHFPREQILTLDAEDLRTATAATLARVLEFIGVDPNFAAPNVDEQFHSSSNRRQKSALQRYVKHPVLRRAIRPFLPARFTERQPFDRPTPSPDDTKRLVEALRPDIERFRRLTGLPFSDWPV